MVVRLLTRKCVTRPQWVNSNQLHMLTHNMRFSSTADKMFCMLYDEGCTQLKLILIQIRVMMTKMPSIIRVTFNQKESLRKNSLLIWKSALQSWDRMLNTFVLISTCDNTGERPITANDQQICWNKYHQTSNMRRTKYQYLNDSHLVLH